MGLKNGRLLVLSDIASVEVLSSALKDRDYDKMRAQINAFKLATLKKNDFSAEGNPDVSEAELPYAKSYIDNRRKAVREAVRGLKEGLFTDPGSMIITDISSTYEDVRYLAGLVKEYIDNYSELKREKGLMDFGDLEHFAFRILDQDEAAAYYRDKFRYIFVDEYQDSNVLQEALIGRIAGERNLFTVGDVKQSIYKFRLAEPEIFQKRYRDYKKLQKELGDDTPSEKIDLNKNFRSKDSIIDLVNEIFQETMEDYGEDEALYAGDPASDRDNYPPKLFLVNEDWGEDENIDDAIKELKKTEKEALLTVKLIRDYLGKTIYDSKEECERPLTKKDIVILMRGIKDRGVEVLRFTSTGPSELKRLETSGAGMPMAGIEKDIRLSAAGDLSA